MQNLPISAEQLRVMACAHPFKLAHEEHWLVPGQSLWEILYQLQPDIEHLHAHVWVNDFYVARELWRSTYPAPGSDIAIRVVPGKKGGLGRMIGTIFIAIAAIAIAALTTWATAGALGPVWAGVLGSFAGMAVGIVGTMALNALFPPTTKQGALAALSARPGTLDYGQTSPTLQITGASNKENLYGPIPKVLGKHRMAPPYGARTYTESAGNDQYLRILFIWGFGPVLLEDLRIGETPIANFQGVEMEHRNLTYDGTTYGDDPITLYPATIAEEPLSIELLRDEENVHSSGLDADELSVDITCPSGLIAFTQEGSTYAITITFDVSYRATGSGDPFAAAGTISMTGNTKAAVKGNLQWKVPRGQYDIKVVRTFIDDSIWSTSVSYWTALRTITNEDPIADFPFPLAKTAMRIKATGQLNGTVDELKGTVTSICPDWEPDYSPAYPIAHADPYVKATSHYPGAEWPWEATNPANPLTGGWVNSWLSDSTSPNGDINQAFHVDLGEAKEITRIYYENNHYEGNFGNACNVGAKNFTLWGSNDPDAFSETDYAIDTGWTQIGGAMQFARHVEADEPDPQYLTVASAASYRYYRLKIADNWGYNGMMGLRRLVLQTGHTWITRATQNPASLYREAVQGAQNVKPLADARLDLTKLAYWHEYCETQGWKFNKVIDYVAAVKDVLDEIAAAGRAAFSWIDSLLGVIIDEPQTFTLGPAFTPRNIVKGSFQGGIAYPDLPHAWRVQFVNEDMGYQQDERIVLDDGYQIGGLDAWGASHPEYPEATIFEQLDLAGVTDPELVFRHGRYHIAQARLRPETFQFGTDIEWLVATRGDRIKFAHDVMLTGLSWGRVTALHLDGVSYIAAVSVDELLPMEAGTSYCLRFRLADNTSLLCNIITVVDGSQYPPAQNGTYIKATSKYDTNYWPYFATDPAKSLTGDVTGNSWIAQDGVTGSQRLHIDLGEPKLITRLYYENFHYFGLISEVGAKNFTLWGSNDAGAFGELTYGTDTNWTQIGGALQFARHTGADIDDPQYIDLSPAAPYRYYALKIADNWGDLTAMGLRRVELQSDVEKYAVLESPINPANAHPEAGDLFLFGESGLEAIDLMIKSIQPGGDLSATVVAVPYDEAIYTADTGTIPAHDPKITAPVEWWKPVVTDIRSDGSVLLRQPDGSWQSRILALLFRPCALHGDITGVEAQFWINGSGEPPVTLPVVSLDVGEISLAPVEDGQEYSFRLRYVKKDGSRGGWCDTETHTVEGKTAPPSNVTGFNVYQVQSVITAAWTGVADLDLAGYEIRYGAVGCAWEDADKINGTFMGSTFSTTEVPPGAWDFLIKAIDTSGNYSETATRKTFQVFSFYAILSEMEQFHLWPGTLTNYVRNPITGNLNPDDQDIPSGNDFDVFDNYVVNPYATSSYEAPEIDLGADESVRMWGRIVSNLGPGESGSNAPGMEVDYRLAGGAYDGFEAWTIDYLTGRYVKAKAVNDNAVGLVRLTRFQPVIDQSEAI